MTSHVEFQNILAILKGLQFPASTALFRWRKSELEPTLAETSTKLISL